ncbi:unnamed protein product, partial [Scytosiphon promiscuus]
VVTPPSYVSHGSHTGAGGVTDAGLLGAALVYTIQLGGLFQWAVKQSAEVRRVYVFIFRCRRRF